MRKNGICTIGVIVIGLAAARVAHADTWYVDSDQDTAVHDGSSWAEAFRYLEDAIQAAVSDPNTGDDDIIFVADGTYYVGETRGNTSNSDRTKSFVLRPLMDIRGRFLGISGGSGHEDDPASAPTILSGDIDHDDSGAAPDDGNSLTVVKAGTLLSSVDLSAELVDLTIQGGYHATSDHSGDGDGGGLVVGDGSSPTITRCVIRNNHVPKNYLGGGVYVIGDSSSLTSFVSCTIEDNVAGSGGGLATAQDTKIQLEDCTIQDNTITNDDNPAGGTDADGAGFFLNVNSDGVFLRCQILSNIWLFVPYSGQSQGSDAEGGGGSALGSLLMKDCLIANNRMGGGTASENEYCQPAGGGIHMTDQGILVNCVISENRLDGKFGCYGGGVSFAGAGGRRLHGK